MKQRRWKKGYKVVRKSGKRLRNLGVQMALYYHLGKVTERPQDGGPLCVFNNFHDAYRFMYRHSKYFKIYECLYLESEDGMMWFPGDGESMIPCHVPGKVLADKVKLTRLVTYRERVKIYQYIESILYMIRDGERTKKLNRLRKEKLIGR